MTNYRNEEAEISSVQDFNAATPESGPFAIRVIRLWNTDHMTGEQLEILSKLEGVEKVTLGALAQTRAGLLATSKMNGVTHLTLSESEISDADLTDLSQLVHLSVLELQQCRISDQTLSRLRKALPTVRVVGSGAE